MDAQGYWLHLTGTGLGIRKRQHVIEVCNFVDAGTSIVLWAQAREDFHEPASAGSGDYLFARVWASSPDDL